MGKKHKKSSSSKKERDYNSSESTQVKERGESKEERPLPKLVLKVHKETPAESSKHGLDDSNTREKHKKKKKKDKKHKSRDEEGKKIKKRERSVEDREYEPTVSKIHIRVADLPREDISPVQKMLPYHEPVLSPLHLCLENLLRSLQRKDLYGIFSYPVTDAVAPGYSKVIKEPMDFSTMMKKVENDEYHSIERFRDDFVLMCNNAMLYNAPDTIYYKMASKLLGIGLKMMSRDKILHLKQSIGFTDTIDVEEVDSAVELQDIQVHDEDSLIMRKGLIVEKRKEEKPLKVPDQIFQAAKLAREKLQSKNPRGKIGYLRRDKDGTTSLSILNPDLSGRHSLPISLGKIAGKVQGGTSQTLSVKEDKKNRVHTVNSLVYGPYGSFGPVYDSSLSTVTKEDTDLLLDAYGCEVGIQYAESLKTFVGDCAGFAQDLVDKFLNALTDGAHGVYLKKKKQKMEEEEQKAIEDFKNIDFNALQSLESEGIDVSFLNDMIPKSGDASLQGDQANILSKLQANSTLLHDLQTAQSRRLGKQVLSTAPTEEEANITKHLTDNFKELLNKVHPSDVMDVSAIQAAMGIGSIEEDSCTSDDEDTTAVNNDDGDDHNALGEPRISEEEKDLPRETRCALAQLRSRYSSLLNSYLNRIDSTVTDASPDCGASPHDSAHLFNCPLKPAVAYSPQGDTYNLDVESLWMFSKEATAHLGLDVGGEEQEEE